MLNYEIDSRKVKPGQTFVAIKGHRVDGHDYINAAIENGATKIITEKKLDVNVDYEIVDNSEIFLINKLVNEYSHILNDLKLIGITGTNGKTTTAFIVYQLLKEFNVNAGYIGTLGYYYNDTFEVLDNTTPDILNLYKLLLNAKEKGITHMVMEVSSHAIDLRRIEGLKFNIGVFTNLSQDHLDYHLTMEAYLDAKLKFTNYLTSDAVFITNSDDDKSKFFKEKVQKHYSVGLDGDYKIENYEILPHETNLEFSFKDKLYKSKYNLTNKFNIYNYLQAVAILNNLNYSIEDIIEKSINISSPKGRCETIEINKGYAVVDFAHAPDAVEKVLESYNEVKTNRLITILGCGGDRDRKKRPLMGNAASRLSDYVIFTSDNPRTEDPNQIMNDILSGVDKDNYDVELNRREAIKKAINMMKENDIVMILGKGHETDQTIGTTKYHFDDAEEVLKLKNVENK